MSDDEDYGPAMAALTDKQRAFVMAMIEFPGITQAGAAEMAGYQNSAGGMRVMGHYCTHNPNVQAALREEAGKRLNSSSLTAAGVLLQLLTDEAVEPKDRIKAAGMLLDRSGFGAAQTINVNKTVTDRSGKAVMARLQELALKHGIDPMKLLDGPSNGTEKINMTQPDTVEAEFTEVSE